MQVNPRELYAKIDTMFSTEDPTPPLYKLGNSIVTSVYNKEFATGYVLLKELTRLGNQLPIEVFFRDDELTTQQIKILTEVAPDKISVKQIQGNAKNFTTQYGTTAGWSTKIYALYESIYSENLWIDSDNFPIENPEFLFKDDEYQAKNSLFWRDVISIDRANRYHDSAAIWPVFNVSPNDAEPFETGQFLINKPHCWQQFRLVKHYADNCEIYYNFGGDAETFRMAWQHWHLRKGNQLWHINAQSDPLTPYGFMPFGPFHKGVANQFNKWGGGTVMVQRNRVGAELFNHRNINKMTLDKNVWNWDIQNEEHYHRHIDALKEIIKYG